MVGQPIVPLCILELYHAFVSQSLTNHPLVRKNEPFYLVGKWLISITLRFNHIPCVSDLALNGFAEKSEKLKYKQKFEQADKNAKIWKDRFEKLNKDYEELKQKAQPFLDAIEIASEKVWAFINAILARGKELYEHKHPARNRGQDMEI